ncbi:Major facilitator superfamily domain general substrate transporter [Penicillium chermesinum]|nr:Major facilitator superfamily domain general substrate transporter [Penicillium chermesinum]
MQKYFGLRGTHLNIMISVIAGLDFLLFGYDQGVMGGLLTLDSFVKTFPEIDTTKAGTVGLTAEQKSTRSNVQGITTASYNLGCFFGAVACIWVGNYLGRRKTIFAGSIVMVIGAVLQCSAYSLPHFIVGRIVTGIGNGFNTSTVPTWQSECSKAHHRGKLVMLEGALIAGGITISYWIDLAFSFLDPSSVAWRFPIAFQNVFTLVILFFVLPLPESPRWLIMKGREEEAMDVLSVILDLPENDPYVYAEFGVIKSAVMEQSSASFRDLFTMDENRNFHRVLLAYVNQMFQQIGGINLITYYAATIYENSIGMDGLTSRILAAANGTEYFLASLLPIFIVEKVGRRVLMLVGSAGCAISMAVLAITTSFEGNSQAGIAAAVFLFVFNTFFAWGWLGMTWLYPAEIVPLRIRAPANALSTSANWIFNFLIVMITPVSFNSIQYRTYIIFAVINAVIFPIVYFFYPETAYRSLEEVDIIFNKTKSVFSLVSVARNEPHRYGKHGELLNYEDTAGNLRRASDSSEKHGVAFGASDHVETGKAEIAVEKQMESTTDNSD